MWPDVLRRDVFIAVPRQHDYILGSTGVSWTVDRVLGATSVSRISTGERSEVQARSAARALAARDGTDAWQVAGIGSYRLIWRGRPTG